jgi:rod shape-determining protein MreC
MGISLFMVFNYNRYQHAVYSAAAGEITGRINDQYNNVEYYFRLKRTNDSLVKANAELYNKLKIDFELPDTTTKIEIDTMTIDTLLRERKYLYMPANVIGNSVSLDNNYIQLHRGLKQGVSIDLGVTDINNAVVGSVVDVSSNYSVVMSLLHHQSNVSAKLKKSGDLGSIIWDGVQPNLVILKDISKDVKVNKGDTVITSGYSDKFPYGLLIGTVSQIENDKASTTYIIKVKTAVNFNNLQYAYIISNLQKDEPQKLLNRVKKINE